MHIKKMQTGSDGNGMLWLADFSTLDKCNQTRVRAWCQFIPSLQSCLQSRIRILLWAPFLFPHVSNSLLCSSWGSNEAPGHIPEQGNGLYLNMLQCITQEHLNLLTAEAEFTWSSHSLQKQRAYNAPAAHTWEPAQVSSLLTHIHEMGHREWIGETTIMMYNQHSARKSTCPSVFVSHPTLIAYYRNVLFPALKPILSVPVTSACWQYNQDLQQFCTRILLCGWKR